jgi:hypothetical protein
MEAGGAVFAVPMALFDPFNTNSLRSMYLKKFRRLTVRFGEKVSGTDYWADAGRSS